MNENDVKYFIESALFASDKPLKLDKIESLFEENMKPERALIRKCIKLLQDEYEPRNIELIKHASPRLWGSPYVSSKSSLDRQR